jgi:hypothetical protein
MHWIHLVVERDQWRVSVDKVGILGFLKRQYISFPAERLSDFQGLYSTGLVEAFRRYNEALLTRS